MTNSYITPEQLVNASSDANTLADFVNGDPATIISRLGKSYDNLAKIAQVSFNALQTVSDILSTANSVVTNGFIPYATLADMNADSPKDGVIGIVLADPVIANNGTKFRKNGVWVDAVDRVTDLSNKLINMFENLQNGFFTNNASGGTSLSFNTLIEPIITPFMFGAVGDGVTDDYAAFTKAISACPYGGKLYVNAHKNYYLSANPFPESLWKGLQIEFGYGCRFVGPGSSKNSTFRRLFTNPWVIADGPYYYSTDEQDFSPIGGALSRFTMEVNGPSGVANVSFTGTLTNGSQYITNVSSLTNVKKGMVISGTNSGWPTTQLFVYDIDTANSTITIGTISSGSDGVYVWTGSTTSDTMTAQFRTDQCGQYIGMSSGWNTSGLVTQCGLNIVMNQNAGVTGDYEGLEIDVNNNSGGTASPWGMLITGNGNTDCNQAIRIERTNNTWKKGIQLYNVTEGIHINALSDCIVFDDTYRDQDGNTANPATFMRSYYNPIAPYHNIMQMTQIVSGSAMYQLFRKSDSDISANGRYITCMNAAGTSELFLVKEDGTVAMYGPNTGNGSTTNSGGLSVSGVTIQSGSNLQLGNTALSGTVTATKTLTIYDETGTAYKINVAPA